MVDWLTLWDKINSGPEMEEKKFDLKVYKFGFYWPSIFLVPIENNHQIFE